MFLVVTVWQKLAVSKHEQFGIRIMLLKIISAIALLRFASKSSKFSSERVFPLQSRHNHAAATVELRWFRRAKIGIRPRLDS